MCLICWIQQCQAVLNVAIKPVWPEPHSLIFYQLILFIHKYLLLICSSVLVEIRNDTAWTLTWKVCRTINHGKKPTSFVKLVGCSGKQLQEIMHHLKFFKRIISIKKQSLNSNRRSIYQLTTEKSPEIKIMSWNKGLNVSLLTVWHQLVRTKKICPQKHHDSYDSQISQRLNLQFYQNFSLLISGQD